MLKFYIAALLEKVGRLKRKKTKEKKKKPSSLTMMIIPNTHGTAVKSYNVPMWLVKCCVAISATCVLIVGYFVTGYFYLNYVARENEELKQINMAQAKEIKELKGITGDMAQKLQALIKLDSEIRAKVGLTKGVKEEKAVRVLESSRSFGRYQFMTMGLGGPGTNQIQLPQNAMIPYIAEEPADTGLVSANDQQVSEQQEVMELPALEGEMDTLEELKEQLAQMDALLTQQAENIDKLKNDVEKQLAYENARPTAWPMMGRLTSPFGWRKNPYSHRGSEFHPGIDLAGPYGTPIRAAADGVVTFAGWKAGWGKNILISHGYGYVTQYAHNSSLLVKEGDKVKKGQIIARLGSTGRSTGPHLHFGVAKNGKWINPLNELKH
jgi:murein DD-endopeptidase MepM/ murein hydrolase activator NlpD